MRGVGVGSVHESEGCTSVWGARRTTTRTSEDVKEEGLDVVVQRLVVQEELGQQAQVLAVHLVVLAVHLKHAQAAVAVDFVPRRVAQVALALVPLQRLAALNVLEAELAHEELVLAQVLAAVAVGVGRVVPRVNLVAPQLDARDVLDLGDLLVLLLQRGAGGVHAAVVAAAAAAAPRAALVVLALVPPRLFAPALARLLLLRHAPAHARVADPLVQAAIDCARGQGRGAWGVGRVRGVCVRWCSERERVAGAAWGAHWARLERGVQTRAPAPSPHAQSM